MFIQSQISDELLQARVLLFQLLEATQFGYAHPFELSFPSVEGLLANAGLTADLGDRPARLDAGRRQSLRR